MALRLGFPPVNEGDTSVGDFLRGFCDGLAVSHLYSGGLLALPLETTCSAGESVSFQVRAWDLLKDEMPPEQVAKLALDWTSSDSSKVEVQYPRKGVPAAAL